MARRKRSLLVLPVAVVLSGYFRFAAAAAPDERQENAEAAEQSRGHTETQWVADPERGWVRTGEDSRNDENNKPKQKSKGKLRKDTRTKK